MKVVEICLFVTVIFLLLSCGTAGNTRNFSSKELSLNEDLLITIISSSNNLSSVKINGKYFSSMDKSKLIAELKISIINRGNKDHEYDELKALEMVFLRTSGELYFSQFAFVLDLNTSNTKKMFPQEKTVNDTLAFTHDKGDIPVAVTTNRQNKIVLIDETNSMYNKAISFLEMHSNIQEMLSMAQQDSFEIVNEFRKENNIDINATNRQGMDILFTGILSRNDSVVNGAIEDGIDIHHKISIEYSETVEPIHLAFLVHNKNAVQILLKAGADTGDIRTGKNPAAVIAVRTNNIEALKLLKEFGVDLKLLMMPMNWSASIPALKYAKDRNMVELTQFLESL